ncbi:MAG: hypothetical protein RDV48_15070 [Candidatus Eremiobacteraeota bacterium]|nr:hypothetical protein [Candidatus Eremiobacteraeota bacterium]
MGIGLVSQWGRKGAGILILVLMLALFSAAALAKDFESFTISFSSGSPMGTIAVSCQNATVEREGGGLSHLLMDKPGSSTLKGTFTLDRMPQQLYLQINHRTSTLAELTKNPTYSITVNGSPVTTMELYFDIYTILGYDIGKYCHTGNNDFEIKLEPTAKTSLYVRQVDISPVVSFVEGYKEKGMSISNWWLYIPLYIAYFLLIAVTISYLLFVIMWRNRIEPTLATFVALFLCGVGFFVLPFLMFGLGWYQLLFSFLGLIGGIVWITSMHR